MLIGELGGAPSPGRPGQEAQLHQVGFIYVFQGHSLFANGGSQGFQAYGAAAIILNDGSVFSFIRLLFWFARDFMEGEGI